jgi:hypothetical protein
MPPGSFPTRVSFGTLVVSVGLALPLLGRASPVGQSASIGGASPGEGVSVGGPVPDWVVQVKDDGAFPPGADAASEPVEYRLLDEQVRIGDGPKERFVRRIYKIANEQGIRDLSEIRIDFDPAYETVAFHTAVVRRNGTETSRLISNDLHVLQRESDLDAHVYDQRMTVLLFLEDVRVGDEIESAYTIRGENPAFEGRDTEQWEFAWSVPVAKCAYRLLAPHDRLAHERSQGAPAATVTASGDRRESRWDIRGIAAIRPESGVPAWYDAYPSFRQTDFDGWSDVARWAAEMYASPEKLSPDLEERVASIAAASASRAERVERAWAFVRDEVRYLALEIGPSSHRPSDPDLVLRRRFGDCKDKARLLMTILHGLGIEARVALVHSRIGRDLRSRLPAPSAFDHAIVRVELDGRTRWIDPTIASARGSFDRIAGLGYGWALVIDPSTTDLVEIASDPANESRTEIEARFDASSFDKDARMTVETTYCGQDADRTRNSLAAAGKEKLGKDYLNYYARCYPRIRETAALEIRDDPRENVLVTFESYVVPSFWKPQQETGKFVARFEAPEIAAIASSPSMPVRTMPLAVRFPQHFRLHVGASLPEICRIKPSENTVRDPAFEYSFRTTFTDARLDLRYAYDALRDSVPPEDVPGHTERLHEVRVTTAYEITQLTESRLAARREEAASKLNPGVLAFAAISLVLNAIGCVFLFRFRSRKPPPPPWTGEPELVGIRGWLVLCAIGIVLTPLQVAPRVFHLVQTAAGPGFDLITTPGTTHYRPMVGLLVLGDVFIDIAILCVSVVEIPLFFGRRRIFPNVLIASRLAFGFFLLADHVLSRTLTNPKPDTRIAGLVASTFGVVIWVLYFWLSRRVRATFVR